ncbi:MAG: exonuclease domain-containing protein [Albidovulum sp.]
MADPLSPRRRLLLVFAAIAAGCLAGLILGVWLGYQRHVTAGALAGFVTAGLVAGFVITGVLAWGWVLLDAHGARAATRLAAALRAGRPEGISDVDATHLGDLGPAATALAARHAQTRAALDQAVTRQTEQLEGEKARLEALLSDVPAGVLLCSSSHQMVFYNPQAAAFLGADAGLNRSLLDYLRDAPLTHAYARLIAAEDHDTVADLLVATNGGARMLSGRMRLLDEAGYVLTLRDVTADLAAHAGQDRLLADIFDGIRRPAANLQTGIGVLAEAGSSAALNAALVQEVGVLTAAVNDLGARYDAARGQWAALPATRTSDLADGLRARMETQGLGLEADLPDMILRCDGFEIVVLLAGFARRLAESGRSRDFSFSVTAEGAGVVLDLGWHGQSLPVGELEGWLDAPLDPAIPDVTGRAVLVAHASDCWPETGQGRALIRLPIRDARLAGAPVAPLSRQVTYDFDLLFPPRAEALADTLLEDLTYVVFDTETTGLLPDEGDEIVQIAALRLVNGRKVPGEVFDMLVNPGRLIPPKSTDVHGISDAMVADAPDVVEALGRFHKFAAGAVLVAHNAPFDMTFLRRREGEIGGAFDHPVLDTVLLSAVAYGRTESHSLDALTQRLGITIPEEARHTALGDTQATAEAFLRLLEILKARGLVRFGDVLGEVRKHRRLLQDLNA